jgi:hypothetical protein
LDPLLVVGNPHTQNGKDIVTMAVYLPEHLGAVILFS